jgi:phosphoribosylformylglycinamidine synthase
VQGNTIAGCQTPRSSSAAVIRLDDAFSALSFEKEPLGQNTPAIALVAGCQERWIEIDPLHGAAQSTLLLARRIVASGGKPLAMTDCLNFGSPRQPVVMRQLSDAIDGINSIARGMQIPIVSGNVSLNNQTGQKPIPPTPMVGMVGVISQSNETLSDVPEHDADIWWIASKNVSQLSSFGLSEWAWTVFHMNAGPVPEPDLSAEQNIWTVLTELHKNGDLASCSAVGAGGVLGTLLTAAVRQSAGIAWSNAGQELSLHTLCSEGQTGVLVTLRDTAQSRALLEKSASERNLMAVPLGRLIPENVLTDDAALWQAAHASFKDALKPFFK